MEDRCICCGTVVPEGQMVCPICIAHVGEENEHVHPGGRFGFIRWLFRVKNNMCFKQNTSGIKNPDKKMSREKTI